jgi:transcriptional regulator with XRE-family HTH domain
MGGTSASTLSAYESGRSVPSVRTLERLVRSAGFELQVSLQLALAEPDQLPRRQRGLLQFPKFPLTPYR